MFATGGQDGAPYPVHRTHRGELSATPPTGKRIDYLSNELHRIADGKIAEEWICSDMLKLMQIGAIPAKHLFRSGLRDTASGSGPALVSRLASC
jgi:hypothetical protein